MFTLMQNLHLNVFTYDVREGGLLAGKMNSRKKRKRHARVKRY